MNAVMYRGIGQIAVEQIEKPVMSAKDYMVEVLYSGLCGTDIKTYKQGHRYFTPPCVLGHEFSGRIVDAGADRQDVHVAVVDGAAGGGDRGTAGLVVDGHALVHVVIHDHHLI